MSYFKNLLIEMEETDLIDEFDLPEPKKNHLKRKRIKTKKIKNPCGQCLTSEGTRSLGLCLWCYCDPIHHWNWP